MFGICLFGLSLSCLADFISNNSEYLLLRADRWTVGLVHYSDDVNCGKKYRNIMFKTLYSLYIQCDKRVM